MSMKKLVLKFIFITWIFYFISLSLLVWTESCGNDLGWRSKTIDISFLFILGLINY